MKVYYCVNSWLMVVEDHWSCTTWYGVHILVRGTKIPIRKNYLLRRR